MKINLYQQTRALNQLETYFQSLHLVIVLLINVKHEYKKNKLKIYIPNRLTVGCLLIF